MFSEEKTSSRSSVAKDYLVEKDTTDVFKNNEKPLAAPTSKENLQKWESYATGETQIPSKSLSEKQSSAPLSTHHSVNAQTGSARVSASLPRSYQKTDTSRLTSVVTPRPFGVHTRGISSLPRSFTVKTSFFLMYMNVIILSKSPNSTFNIVINYLPNYLWLHYTGHINNGADYFVSMLKHLLIYILNDHLLIVLVLWSDCVNSNLFFCKVSCQKFF